MNDNGLRFWSGAEIVDGVAVAVPAGIGVETKPDFVKGIRRPADHVLVMAAPVIDGARHIVNMRRIGGVWRQTMDLDERQGPAVGSTDHLGTPGDIITPAKPAAKV